MFTLTGTAFKPSVNCRTYKFRFHNADILRAENTTARFSSDTQTRENEKLPATRKSKDKVTAVLSLPIIVHFLDKRIFKKIF